MYDKDDLSLLKDLIEVLWDSLGSGVWLEPGDYEALRTFHNTMAQAAEDVCIVGRRVFDE
jgi:hypothetical protein